MTARAEASDPARPDPGKVMALDLGSRRIGVAVSNTRRTMAFPVETIARGADPVADRAVVRDAAVSAGVSTVVVGLPLSLDGSHGRAARAATDEAGRLADELAPFGIAVATFDERLTTVSAERALVGAGHHGPARRRRVDSAAATVLLQAWLDAR